MEASVVSFKGMMLEDAFQKTIFIKDRERLSNLTSLIDC